MLNVQDICINNRCVHTDFVKLLTLWSQNKSFEKNKSSFKKQINL